MVIFRILSNSWVLQSLEGGICIGYSMAMMRIYITFILQVTVLYVVYTTVGQSNS